MPSPDTAIAIVGAGAAGIAAALECRAYGLPCRVIEARRRTGGRCWTDRQALGRPFDIGASWIHGADKGNPFAEIAHALGRRTVNDRRDRRLFDRQGRRLGPAELTTLLDTRERGIAAMAAAPPGASLADALPTGGGWEGETRAFAGPWLCGTDCDETDAADWCAAIEGDDWLLPDGYGTLVQLLAQDLEVTLACPLTAIEVEAKQVRLRTARGSFTAGAVILTVPLGVLRAEAIRFSPPLPPSVLNALDALPMGLLMKIGLALEADPLGEGRSCYLHYPVTDEAGVLYYLRPAGADLAFAFIGGSAARALERAGPDAAREAALAPLRDMLGPATVDRAFGPSLVTAWGADPWSRGSYSIARPGGAGAREVLREPVHERLHLAGEASAPPGWHATVGGAWLAGRAAVRRALGTLPD